MLAHASLYAAAETSSSSMLELRPFSSTRRMHARTHVCSRNPAGDLQPLVLAPDAGHVHRAFMVKARLGLDSVQFVQDTYYVTNTTCSLVASTPTIHP